MLTQFIDKNGEIWDGASPRLRVSYHAGPATAGFENFIIKNLGFAEIRLSDDSIALKVAPAHMTLKTCAAVNGILSKQMPRRILLSWYDGQWHHELISSCQGAYKRLLKLKASSDNRSLSKQVERQRTLNELNGNDPFSQVLELWRASSQTVELQRDREALNKCVNARYALVHADNETAKLFFSSIGEGIILYDKSWRQLAPGLRVEDQPDYEYAKWLSGCYHEAMISNEPRLSDIDAMIWAPQQGERRIRYTRLTLPVVSPTGDATLLSVTRRDPNIELRIELHDEAE